MLKKEFAVIILGYILNVFLFMWYFIGFDFFSENEYLSRAMFLSLMGESFRVAVFTLAPVVGLYYVNKRRKKEGKTII